MSLHIMSSSGEAFVYCWTDKRDNKFYFGYHKGKEDDGYVCSSKLMMEQYKHRSQDFVREIIAYGAKEECHDLETAILQTIDAKHMKNVYNQTNGDWEYVFKGHTEDSKNKIRESRMGKKATPETIEKLSESHKGIFAGEKHPMWGRKGIDNPNFGSHRTEETCKKLAVAQTGKRFTEEVKRQMSIERTGKPHPRKKSKCPHCGLYGDSAGLTRYHFDNCKNKFKAVL